LRLFRLGFPLALSERLLDAALRLLWLPDSSLQRIELALSSSRLPVTLRSSATAG
jgi:hypothetical protein